MILSTDLSQNIATLHELLPIDESFDLVTRDLYLGETPAYWIGVNGFCRTEVLQQIFSDLQNPVFTEDGRVEDLICYMNAKIGFAQVEAEADWDRLVKSLVSGPSLLFVEGFGRALVIDARSYPTRGVAEPDAERISKGSRDGFVETLLFNANLIRRRVRSPGLTFAMHSVGERSRTDVAVVYLKDGVNEDLLDAVNHALDALEVTSLTMGSKSLEELLAPHRWWNPLPAMQYTERPDVACSYLMEGHILIIVDNSPLVLILPCTVFQFTQSAEDYHRSPTVGGYFRLVRFACIPVSLFLMPLFLLITAYYPRLAVEWRLVEGDVPGRWRMIFYVLAVEFVLDLFKYAAALSPGRFSGSMAIVGGLLIGDVAVTLNWASTEVLFYGAVTLLAAMSISSSEFSDALRVYRIFLLVTTALGGIWGFGMGAFLVLASALTTPTFGGMSYFWPLCPWNGKALLRLLFRSPTFAAQPGTIWDRGPVRREK